MHEHATTDGNSNVGNQIENKKKHWLCRIDTDCACLDKGLENIGKLLVGHCSPTQHLALSAEALLI